MAVDPYLVLKGVSALTSFSASRSAAKAAQREAAIRARQIKAEKETAKLVALQEHNKRMSNLSAFIGMNEALAGTMGRDLGSDRSLQAIINKAKEDTATDVTRANVQSVMEQSKLAFQKDMALEKGSNIARGYRYQAFGTLLQGAYQTKGLLPKTSTAQPTYYGQTFNRAF